jgi:hypothetical protein
MAERAHLPKRSTDAGTYHKEGFLAWLSAGWPKPSRRQEQKVILNDEPVVIQPKNDQQSFK